ALETRFRDRHALVVVRGPGHKRDLRIVRPYIRDFRPGLGAVDGGADALLESGYKPDVIVGDMDSVSDSALRSGAELVVQAYEDGRAPGADRLRGLGPDQHVVPAPARRSSSRPTRTGVRRGPIGSAASASTTTSCPRRRRARTWRSCWRSRR